MFNKTSSLLYCMICFRTHVVTLALTSDTRAVSTVTKFQGFLICLERDGVSVTRWLAHTLDQSRPSQVFVAIVAEKGDAG